MHYVPDNGVWRSPVAHLYGVQVVGGSNPLTPTDNKARGDAVKPLLALLYTIDPLFFKPSLLGKCSNRVATDLCLLAAAPAPTLF